MYGEEQLNSHNILKYALTKEFFSIFHALKYGNIEIPLTLVRLFHVYIKSFVDANLDNTSFINRLQEAHKLYTMKDVQAALQRRPGVVRNLSKVTHRKTIMMPAILVHFALEQLPRSNVILVVSNFRDKEALKGVRLPKNFACYNYHRHVRSIQVSKQIKIRIGRLIDRILGANSHPIFSTPAFKKWLYLQSIKSIKMIHALDLFIRKRPIGLILDHVEIVNPGNTLSLLALKYKLPFINAPQLLVADRSLIPSRAAYYYVWGLNYKNWLQKRGIPESKIKMVGNLRFHYAFRGSHVDKSNLRLQMNIPDHHFIVTYTSQPFPEKVNQLVMEWISSVKEVLPITFIIKSHPMDKTDYSKFLNHSNIVLSPGNMGIYDVLCKTDFLMTISSNTAIEAAMVGKGIIVLQPELPYDYDHHNNQFNAFLANSSAGAVVYNKRGLNRTVKKICNNHKYRKELIIQANQFLQQTLQTNSSPSIQIRKLIQCILKEKSRR